MPNDLILSSEVRDVLQRCAITDERVYLPQEQLPRPLYVAVDKALRAAGGKWNKHLQCHVFTRNPRATLLPGIGTGSVPKIQQQLQSFYTPPALAAQVVALAELEPGMCVLEPSAGMGALALEAAKTVPKTQIWCVDSDPLACTVLRNHGFAYVVEQNFLQWSPDVRFDRVLMNPPYANGADMAHIQHAHQLLGPGGRLVAIVPAMTGKKTRKNTEKAFLQFLDQYLAQRIEVPAGAFAASGTQVATSLLVLHT